MAQTFLLMGKNGPMEPYNPPALEVGQKIIDYGYGMTEERGWAVGRVIDEKEGMYLLVNLQTYQLHRAEFIRSIDDQFGIGFYYLPGEFHDLADVKEALDIAYKKQAQKERLEQEKQAEAERKLEEGRRILEKIKPVWAKAVIVAAEYVDKSDPMTDYFHTYLSNKYLLAWSRHERNLFSEMRKAARNFKETAFYFDDPKPSDEQRENYSMGKGMYLHRRGQSWAIRKIPLYKYSLEDVARILGDGGNKIPEIKQPTAPKKIEGVTVTLNEEKGGVEIRFPEKPEKSTIDALKEHGFRWSRFNRCWWHRQTPEAVEFANSLK